MNSHLFNWIHSCRTLAGNAIELRYAVGASISCITMVNKASWKLHFQTVNSWNLNYYQTIFNDLIIFINWGIVYHFEPLTSIVLIETIQRITKLLGVRGYKYWNYNSISHYSLKMKLLMFVAFALVALCPLVASRGATSACE